MGNTGLNSATSWIFSVFTSGSSTRRASGIDCSDVFECLDTDDGEDVGSLVH